MNQGLGSNRRMLLAILLIAPILLTGAGAVSAADVIFAPDTRRAVRIENLEVGGEMYDVDFRVGINGDEVYGLFPGTYQFPDEALAEEAHNAVVLALNVANASSVGETGSSVDGSVFSLGFEGIEDLGLLFILVHRAAYADNENDWVPTGENAWPYSDENIWAVFPGDGMGGGGEPGDGGEGYLISAASQAAGAGGSFWQTDVDVNNFGDAGVGFRFVWFPRGADNSEPLASVNYDLEPGASERFENILASVFSLPEGSNGAVGVIAPNDRLIVNSRTFNLPQVKVTGTFGQAIAGVAEDQMIEAGETWRITFMTESSDLRANLGCASAVNQAIEILLDLYDDSGTFLETITMNLAPLSNNQVNRIFGSYSPINGYVDVSSQTDGARFYCYGSVLDNGSSDPTTIVPIPLS